VQLDDCLHPRVVTSQERPKHLGSVRSPSAVDPVRSQKTTVTVLRTSRPVAAVASGAPQPLQKPASIAFSRPQPPQMSTTLRLSDREAPYLPCGGMGGSVTVRMG
jgi:hypothetical protein